MSVAMRWAITALTVFSTAPTACLQPTTADTSILGVFTQQLTRVYRKCVPSMVFVNSGNTRNHPAFAVIASVWCALDGKRQKLSDVHGCFVVVVIAVVRCGEPARCNKAYLQDGRNHLVGLRVDHRKTVGTRVGN